MARPRVSSLDDPLVDLWISIPASMKRQLEDKKVNISALARGYFAEYLNSGPCEDVEIRKELEVLEPKVMLLKARAEELDKRKQTVKSHDLEMQAKRDRWFQDAAEFISTSNPGSTMVEEMIEQRAGYCEMSPEEFKAEFEKRYPGKLAKVLSPPARKRSRS